MAADRKSDEILLNALVDGELAAVDQAAAAARLAGDRDFARAFATLSKLKASVAETAEDASEPIALKLPPVRRRWVAYATAASMVAVAVLGSAALLLAPMQQPVGQAPVPATVVPVAFAGDPVIPDLSSAGLQLARTVVSASSGAQFLVATYLGPRGCRLELWVSNAGRLAKSAGGTERHSWRVGGLVYELIAYGMPAARFEKVAAAAEEATKATALPDALDQRLIEARVSAAPCLA